jgi:hypothetical protein
MLGFGGKRPPTPNHESTMYRRPITPRSIKPIKNRAKLNAIRSKFRNVKNK